MGRIGLDGAVREHRAWARDVPGTVRDVQWCDIGCRRVLWTHINASSFGQNVNRMQRQSFNFDKMSTRFSGDSDILTNWRIPLCPPFESGKGIHFLACCANFLL